MVCGVYVISFSNTDKVYVGSSKNIESRLKQHKYMLRKGIHHSYKLQDYYTRNKEFIIFKILRQCSEDSRTHHEEHFVNMFDCIKNGFNVSDVIHAGETIRFDPIINSNLNTLEIDTTLLGKPFSLNLSTCCIEAYMREKFRMCSSKGLEYNESIENIASNLDFSTGTIKKAISKLSKICVIRIIKNRSTFNRNSYVWSEPPTTN